MENIARKEFLYTDFQARLNTLKPETKPNFGLMTPQHMVEHLLMAIKGATVRYEGERVNPPTEQQLGMQKFIESGSVLSHRPSDKTAADLPPLNQNSLEEAIALVPNAIQEFYSFYETNADYKPYASYLGEVTFDYVELFHFMHIKYHLWQFGLLEQYP